MIVDVTEDDTLKDEGFTREVINRVQKLRKSVSSNSNSIRNKRNKRMKGVMKLLFK